MVKQKTRERSLSVWQDCVARTNNIVPSFSPDVRPNATISSNFDSVLDKISNIASCLHDSASRFTGPIMRKSLNEAEQSFSIAASISVSMTESKSCAFMTKKATRLVARQNLYEKLP